MSLLPTPLYPPPLSVPFQKGTHISQVVLAFLILLPPPKIIGIYHDWFYAVLGMVPMAFAYIRQVLYPLDHIPHPCKSLLVRTTMTEFRDTLIQYGICRYPTSASGYISRTSLHLLGGHISVFLHSNSTGCRAADTRNVSVLGLGGPPVQQALGPLRVWMRWSG